MKKIISLIFLVLALGSVSFSQNKVWLIDGTVYNSDGKGIVDSNKVLIYNAKMKSKLIDTTDVFAIISGLDTLFLYNSTAYPLEKAKMFMQGQIDGKDYKNSDVYVTAFAVGVVAPFGLSALSFSTFLSPIFSGIFTSVFATVNTENERNILDKRFKQNEEYIRGYRLSATKQKIKNMSIYSVAGLVTGIGLIILIL